ncbi:TMV resistance protein N [Spatholobus suberectus]|nr:TMV resistance protein N [Spatholobus suberectus]
MESVTVEGATATATESECRYDVYLSSTGNAHYGFTGNLYDALRKKRFRAFMNDEGMQSGDQDSPSPLREIEQSRISIVVFSKDYAFSTWCLEELVKIVECMNTKNQQVFPIFYKVAPKIVRQLEKPYGKAMAGHKEEFGKDSEKVQKWRSALSEVAKLPGVHIGGQDRYEYEHIQMIVEKVIQFLPRYNIFLSFRGDDTRYSFTGSLYHALYREGFKTFMDNKGLESGNEISSSLIEAIETSRLSIVVLSEKYVSSPWCLDELVKILECMKTKKQLVWPIFYKVKPSTVRELRNSYGEAMAQHEKELGKDSEQVHKWKTALFEVANLTGYPLESDQYEYELIEKVVKAAIDNDNKNHIPIPSLSFSQETINNDDDDNNLSTSSPSSIVG